MKAPVYMLALGILISSGSLIAASLDSRDLSSALFADRGSERIGLGIQGLRLYDYLVGGIVVTALSGCLLVVKRNETDLIDSISLESQGSAALSSGTMRRLEAAMDSVIRSEEKSSFLKEIEVVKGEGSDTSRTKPIPISGKMDVKTANSLIDSASSLLASKRANKPQDSTASARS